MLRAPRLRKASGDLTLARMTVQILHGWGELMAAFAAFFLSHALPARPALKARLVAVLGRAGYGVAFSLLSTGLLYWLIVATGRAPYVELWPPALWQRWTVNIVMPLVVLLGTFGVAAPNPFAFEGKAKGFDPAHPGIAGVTRQPLLWAMLLWSLAHLLANGDLAHGLMFGAFAALAALGMKLVEARRARAMGAEEWARLTAHTGLLPLAALFDGRWKPQALPSALRLGLAVAIWWSFLELHAPLIGLSPLP
ncbi:NnrU family protein [Phaeovulum sp.]|uniref:NnrU family protein n=1 Tax=Phaeovulum sp. TaxID=2934796 RepID=UPI003565815B